MSYDTIDHIMSGAARIPLLTAEEEIHLARSVQRMQAIQQAKPQGPYSKAEQIAIRRGAKAKDRFVSANIRLVANVAKRYHRALGSSLDLPQEDLMQEGVLGLIRAVEKFDPERGYKFSTYAYWWIRQTIVRGIHSNGRAVRLPVHIHDKLYQLRSRRHELVIKLGRMPTTQDIAEAMDMPIEQLEQAILASTRPASLDMTITDDISPLGDAIPDQRSTGDRLEQLSEEIDMERVRAAVGQLPLLDQQAITMRYGLNGHPPATLTEVGRFLGVTREAARTRCDRATRKIGEALRHDPQLRISPEWTRQSA